MNLLQRLISLVKQAGEENHEDEELSALLWSDAQPRDSQSDTLVLGADEIPAAQSSMVIDDQETQKMVPPAGDLEAEVKEKQAATIPDVKEGSEDLTGNAGEPHKETSLQKMIDPADGAEATWPDHFKLEQG